MTIVTWLAILVLGPGAAALFAWFLRDLGPLLRSMDAEEPPDEGAAP